MMFKFLHILVMTSLWSFTAYAHEGEHSSSAEKFKFVKVTDSISMLQAEGGNIALSNGDQGLFMVDNGLSEKSQIVMDAVKTLSDQPVKILVNTHWHYDHAGNNQGFGEQGTVIIAHENVREQLKNGGTIAAFDKKIEPALASALPVLTYEDQVTVHLNDSDAMIMKMSPAHTDGDSIIFWKDENVLHTGDLFFNGFFPFIDGSSGGSLRGMIAAVEKITGMVDSDTKIIPGHGPLAIKKDLDVYLAMLKDVEHRIKTAKENNLNFKDWAKTEPLSTLGQEWGDGFLPTEKFAEIAWNAY